MLSRYNVSSRMSRSSSFVSPPNTGARSQNGARTRQRRGRTNKRISNQQTRVTNAWAWALARGEDGVRLEAFAVALDHPQVAAHVPRADQATHDVYVAVLARDGICGMAVSREGGRVRRV